MDPQQAIDELIAAIDLDDKTAAYESAAALINWLGKDGFMPRVDRKHLTYLLGIVRIWADETNEGA